MSLVAVIIRHLPGSRPVTTAVIPEPKNRSYTTNELEEFFTKEADTIIKDFKTNFIEFKDANFYVDFMLID